MSGNPEQIKIMGLPAGKKGAVATVSSEDVQ